MFGIADNSLWPGSLLGEKNSEEREGKGEGFSLSPVPRSTKGLFTGYVDKSQIVFIALLALFGLKEPSLQADSV